jgi:DNA-binding response OmpR family regulator
MVITVAYCAGSMSGLELTRRLRLHTRTTAVPIIVLTTETRRQDGELSLKAGADMFLERPVSGDEDLYRVMCCANMWYGCWLPPDVCRSSRHFISATV